MSGNVILDENGDRETDFSIFDYNPKQGCLEKIAEVINNGDGTRVFRKSIKPPMWPGGERDKVG